MYVYIWEKCLFKCSLTKQRELSLFRILSVGISEGGCWGLGVQLHSRILRLLSHICQKFKTNLFYLHLRMYMNFLKWGLYQCVRKCLSSRCWSLVRFSLIAAILWWFYFLNIEPYGEKTLRNLFWRREKRGRNGLEQIFFCLRYIVLHFKWLSGAPSLVVDLSLLCTQSTHFSSTCVLSVDQVTFCILIR